MRSRTCFCRRRACLRDGRRRRHHAPDRKRPVDHRMEADQRRDPAANASRLAACVQPLPANPPISAGRRTSRNDASPASSSSSSGSGFTDCSAGFMGVGFLRRRCAGSRSKRAIPKGYAGASRPIRPRRTAGCRRLVHGAVGTRGSHRGQPLSPVGPPAVCIVPVLGTDLDRARPSRTALGNAIVPAAPYRVGRVSRSAPCSSS